MERGGRRREGEKERRRNKRWNKQNIFCRDLIY
jgi:hypothetical protein